MASDGAIGDAQGGGLILVNRTRQPSIVELVAGEWSCAQSKARS
jgi:hypothetical protein